jgi:hypothetical protein
MEMEGLREAAAWAPPLGPIAQRGEIMAKSEVNKTPEVDAYMIELKHPFKAEVQALRKVLKGVNSQITEQIKWNAPSFGYKGEYLVTFNLRETKRVHLV